MKFPAITELYALFKTHPFVTTDSRNIPASSIFFALKGESFDGNKYADAALHQGCAYAVIDDEQYYKKGNYILVNDSLKALQDLAGYHRRQFKIPFIAITGSNGKTTTKELIKAVLSKKYKVLATIGNLNNHIGVPLTLLSITSETEIAVIEMGANHIGEIALLCEIASPDFGIINNIGKAHLGEFGSFEGVVKAKTEMYEFISKHHGKIFINSGNELLMSKADAIEKITYGNSEKDYCRCQLVDANPFVKVKYQGEEILTKLVGKYNFENIAAAICMGKHFGLDTQNIKTAIEEYIPSNNRSQVIKTKAHTLIMDAYNANPSSMRAAIENFSEMKGKNKWLILGDMLELGVYEIEEHRNILKLISDKKFNNVILVGERFAKAGKGRMEEKFIMIPDSDELVKLLKENSPIENSAMILIKGSRGIKLEKSVECL